MSKPTGYSREQRRLRARYGGWAVVTGASSGIGRALAWRLAEAGLGLVLVARRGDVLEAFGAELTAAHGTQVRIVAVDVAAATGLQAIGRETEALDVGLLVAAAGFGTSGEFVAADASTELEMIDVNCRAVVAVSHLFARRFVARGRGGLLLLSSLVAFQGVPRAANYAATKAFIQSFAEGIGHELRPRGVDVLATAPGPVRSGFGARAAMTMSLAQTPDDVAVATLRALGRRRTVRPGLLAKLLELSLKLLPRWGRVRTMALVMAGMTKGHA
ncbi:MAG: SDR family NAD(P)-dependent oxidoreductase [Verrucomicrobiota bacterium]